MARSWGLPAPTILTLTKLPSGRPQFGVAGLSLVAGWLRRAVAGHEGAFGSAGVIVVDEEAAAQQFARG